MHAIMYRGSPQSTTDHVNVYQDSFEQEYHVRTCITSYINWEISTKEISYTCSSVLVTINIHQNCLVILIGLTIACVVTKVVIV